MVNLHCECQEVKPKGETNSSFLVLHPPSSVHTVKTVGSHLKTRASFSTNDKQNQSQSHLERVIFPALRATVVTGDC